MKRIVNVLDKLSAAPLIVSISAAAVNMMSVPSFLFRSIVGLYICLSLTTGLSAQVAPNGSNHNLLRPFLNGSASSAVRAGVTPGAAEIPCNIITGINLCINGQLGPILSASVLGGNYVSGITATGSTGQTCEISYTNGGGVNGRATVALTGTNAIATNSTLVTVNPGSNYTSTPTTAMVVTGGVGTATCSGTHVSVTTTFDPLGLNTALFTATSTISPDNVVYNGTSTSLTYNNLAVTLAVGLSGTPPLTLPCTGATGVITINDLADAGNDTFRLSNCNFAILSATFSVVVAMKPGSIPAPIPMAFGAPIVVTPNTASQGTYTIVPAPGIPPVATTLAINGGITSTCNNCPSGTVSPTTLTFNASAGGTAPPTQPVTPTTSDGSVLAYALTTSTTSGGTWLTVNGATTGGGDTPTPFNVGISSTVLATLASGTYSGTVTLFDATYPTTSCTAPVVEKVTVTLNVSSGSIPPTITTTSLPNGTVGVAYSQPLHASGGVPPYSNWTVSGGTLPAGLSLNASTGVIGGTPVAAGTSSFSVTVEDSAGSTSAAQPLSINITAGPGPGHQW